MEAAKSGAAGKEVVPKVHLHATHERALDVIDLGELKKWAAEPEVSFISYFLYSLRSWERGSWLVDMNSKDVPKREQIGETILGAK